MRKKNILLICALVVLTSLPSILYAQEVIRGGSKGPVLADEQAQPGKISLDIKGMDIIDVLKILAMRGNLNIVAGKNVRGKVTLFLKNVDVMDALEIILAANDLAYETKGNIINVMSQRDYELLYGEKSYDRKRVKIIRLKFARATEVGKSLNQIKTKIGKVVIDEGSNTIVLIDVPAKIKEMEEVVKNMDLPTLTKTFILNYAKAQDLEAKIKGSLTKNVGEIKIDSRMNKIIVTDLPEKMDYIERIISDFDERDKVVLIEAKIVQITLNKDISYGINWNNVFAGIDVVAVSDLSVTLPSDIGSWPHRFTYTRAHGATEYGDQVILKALERLGKTNVLSTPRITVANNQEAKVLVGTKEAYVTSTITQTDGTATTADNVQFVDVGVRLAVTPTITDDGFIMMKIKPEVSSVTSDPLELTNADGSVRTKVPIVTTSEAETQLLVKDGTTIIMAGLMEDTRTDNTEKIPLLGDIPLLGHFFRSRGKGNEKTELVIFLTPHIVREAEDAAEEAQGYLDRHEKTGITPKDSEAKPLRKSQTGGDAFTVSTEVGAPPKDFQQYCRYISAKVRGNLEKNRPNGMKRQQVQLSFVLSSDGSLKEKPALLGKVDNKMKDLVIKSVEESTPFFPFPQDYQREQESFSLNISFGENP